MCLEIIYFCVYWIDKNKHNKKGYNEEVLTLTAIAFLEIVKVVSPSRL